MNTRTLSVLLIVAVASFALFQNTQAVSPAPDGGYPGANTAEGGTGALFSLTTGSNNTGIGSQALFSLTTGDQNTATGAQALKNNVASQNTADGFQALTRNTQGENNTATGWRALFKNTRGISNTASGSEALYSNTDGNENTAYGFAALLENTTGFNNTATGSAALASNATGIQNTAIGAQALSSTNGANNTAIGFGALGNTSGNRNVALGSGAGSVLTTGDNNIDIGFNVFGEPGEANTIRIGDGQAATFIAGISGTAVTGAAVVVNGSGQLGVMTSSKSFKTNIKPMDKASDALFALEPVTFHYKKEIDPAGISQFGLVAEEVEKVNPDLVVRDKEGKPYSVRYDQVNAMLLNEFLKEHRKVEDLEATVAQLAARLKEQDLKIEKIGNEREISRPALHVAANR